MGAPAHPRASCPAPRAPALSPAPGSQRRALCSQPVLTNYGLALQEAGDAAEAVAAFRKVLELNPSSDAEFNLANALVDAGEAEEADAAFERCLRLNPADAEAYYNRGTAALGAAAGDAAKVRAAMESLEASIGLAPADAKSYASLGDGLAFSSRWDESSAAYRTASRIRPAHAGTHASLGNVLDELGRLKEAESSWRACIAIDPTGNGGGVHTNLGNMLRRDGRTAESREAFDAALSIDPANAEAYMGLGRCYSAPVGGLAQENRSDHDGGYLAHLRETYGAAIELQPTDANAYKAIGEGMAMYGLHGGCDEFGGDGALQMYEHALRLNPADTCAATHVAFGRRPPRQAEAAEGGGAEGGEADEEEGAGLELEDGGARPPPAEVTLESLSARGDVTKGDGLARARSLWQTNGMVVFPELLSTRATDALLKHVREAQHGEHTRDFTVVTRDHAHRTHKALRVSDAQKALSEIASKLQPFLQEALGVAEPALLECGFMVTEPGATAQHFHRDVAPDVVSLSSITASIQVSLVDTAPNQGALEVVPGSQEFDPSVSEKDRLDSLAKVPVAVPRGTVTIYALHLMHRGSANTHTSDRPFMFFTLMGDGLAPPGLAYTVQPDDIGKYAMRAPGKLVKTG